MKAKPVTKRALQGQETRKKIYETAVSLFSKYGYDKVTIDDIVEKAGVSKGAFYNHFASKDQVIVEQFNHLETRYKEWLDHVPAGMTSMEKLHSFLEMAVETDEMSGRAAFRVLYQSQLGPDEKRSPFISSRNLYLYNILDSIVAEGQKNGEIRDDLNSWQITNVAIRCFRGAVFEWCASGSEASLADLVHEVMRLILEVIKK